MTAEPTYENILVERAEGGVGLIRLNRPKVLNALNQATITEVLHAMQTFDNDAEVRAIVLTGSERAFAAGSDIAEMSGKAAPDMLADRRFSQWEELRRVRTPIIGAVAGFCLGGGNELAMLCDVLIAAENATFGQPEINLGIIPGAGGTQRLVRAVGKSLAMEMILTDRRLSADEALRAGLVSRVVPAEALMDEALRVARSVASRAPIAVRLAKTSVLRAFDTTLEVGLELERHNFYLLFSTEDQREGMRAFLEKRPPVWRGR
ncbi:enoyl-CoA hydratase-related protein [Deinococcus maricopensis]|uniref:enoyl-CoA hydratase n=1 Tax=Deinococcus maricopensis (strain DSM 21211 / LMG 22137 / NRRL B-23946 / LB-34) TaxID=709986 RepID=E8UB20_DEIML|nr:enoyl-CoA hydratase-related protein [Deinococcus maricopensis]ADV68259.1 Enoyl-CoA hydratase/isomerase [Deinococcus maricopensis DSM 21211]